MLSPVRSVRGNFLSDPLESQLVHVNVVHQELTSETDFWTLLEILDFQNMDEY